MVVNFSAIDLNDRPILILKNAGGKTLGVLGCANNVSPHLMYNEISTISFELPAYIDGEEVPYYDDVIGMRIIELKDIGQFILLNPKEEDDGVKRHKTCEAKSLEYEFAMKKISVPGGTYKFYDYDATKDSVVGMILELMPSWTIGNISDSLINKYRTFDDTNENVYNFIKGTIQQSYNCIFDFDTLERKINIRDVDEEPASKQVFISHDNLAKKIELTENTDDVVTRLDVNGAEGVDIRDVNPAGTNKLIMLDYYMTRKNFSQEIIDKYAEWKELCDSNRAAYYNLTVQYSLKIMQDTAEEARLTDLRAELTGLENALSVAIQAFSEGLQAQSAIDAANADIASKQIEITQKQAAIDSLQEEINDIFDQLQEIRSLCSFEGYFTDEEMIELDRYIKDDEITESTFAVINRDTYASDGNGFSVEDSDIAVEDAEITKTESSNSVLYDIRGGTISIQGIDLAGDIISSVWDVKNNGVFLATVYLGEGSISEDTYQTASLTITGTCSGMQDNSDGCIDGVVTGYAYFTQNASIFQEHSVAWDLYQYGLDVIKRIAYPTYTFSVDSANFLALKDFESFKNHLELGQRIYTSLREGEILKPILISARFSWGDITTLELEFSDSYVSNDSSFKLVDLLDKSISMGKNLELSKYIYSSFVDSGASTDIKKFMDSALDTAKNAILSSTDQAISWDGAGLRLRKYANEAKTAFANEQIWLTNNSIVMTNDAWATAKMAIGKFHDANTGDVWGVAAPMLVGTLLAGQRLRIESSKKDGGISVFVVDEEGARLYNSDFEIAKTTGGITTHVMIDPETGILIGKSTSQAPLYTLDENDHKVFDYTKAVFYVDTEGNLHVKGNGEFSGVISATSGKIGGWSLVDTTDNGVVTKRLYSGETTTYVAMDAGSTGVDYAFWAGDPNPANAKFKVHRNGTITAVDGVFSGQITATNSTFSGTITATNSTFSGSVTAGSGAIGGWKLASNKLYSLLESTEQVTYTNDQINGSYVAFDSSPSGTYAIWAGHQTAASAPFSVKRDGTLCATKANINGTVTADDGVIAGWSLINSVSGSATTKRLYSGSGTNYVAIDAGSTSMPYAIWAGNETAGNAPFRVNRDGTVYLSKLYAIKNDTSYDPEHPENAEYEPVDLKNYSFWKLNYSTVKKITVNSNSLQIATTGGTYDVNFKTAADITAAVHTVTIDQSDIKLVGDPEYSGGKYNVYVSATCKSTTHNYTYTIGNILTFTPTDAYAAGWAAAKSKISRSGNTIYGPSSTVGDTTTLYTASANYEDTHAISFPESITLVPGQTFTGAAGNYVYKNSVTLTGNAVAYITWS